MTERILATEDDLQAARDLETTGDLDAMANTVRHLWEKLARLRKEAAEREQLYRNAFNLGALEHRRNIELQGRLDTLEGEWLARPRREFEASTPATPIMYFAVPGEPPESVKAFLKSLVGTHPAARRPVKFHVVSRGDFFATDIKFKQIGTPPWTRIEMLFIPEQGAR